MNNIILNPKELGERIRNYVLKEIKHNLILLICYTSHLHIWPL